MLELINHFSKRFLVGIRLFTKSGFCKEYNISEAYYMEINCHSEPIAKRRKLKSFEKEITNFHDKGKDYLRDSEIKALLEA